MVGGADQCVLALEAGLGPHHARSRSIGSYAKTPNSVRKWCKTCGGHILTDHPQWNLIDVYAATIPSFPFKPGVHVHYQESVLTIRDGLPKQKDVPKEMGGSGQLLAE